ncbi:hypothetical protein [uncultured Bifidobacterium sp.]|uniref:hypothetical protein n=1 Tax=uncultured Bifidobacterium sp. TaxID=165187 RepID=UPI0026226A2C|nr:hypothetical protein [uncultured Bifidobacterium sp.]
MAEFADVVRIIKQSENSKGDDGKMKYIEKLKNALDATDWVLESMWFDKAHTRFAVRLDPKPSRCPDKRVDILDISTAGVEGVSEWLQLSRYMNRGAVRESVRRHKPIGGSTHPLPNCELKEMLNLLEWNRI